MTRLILIRAAQTDWQAQGRLVGDTDLTLNAVGRQQAAADRRAVAETGAQGIHCGTEEATRQTAAIVAEALGLKPKASKDFREMNLGHWEGLTVEDFRERFAKVYRQWRSDPLSVEPPEGESVLAVAARQEKGLEKILRRNGGATLVLVLGGFAYAVARCHFEDGGYIHFWDYVDSEEHRHSFEFEQKDKTERQVSAKTESRSAS